MKIRKILFPLRILTKMDHFETISDCLKGRKSLFSSKYTVNAYGTFLLVFGYHPLEILTD